MELVAVLAVLTLILGVTSVEWRRMRPSPAADVVRALDSIRTEAITSGRSAAWRSGAEVVRFQPDGSSSGGRIVLGSATVVVDPLSGAIRVR